MDSGGVGVGVGIPPQSSRLRFMCSYGGQIVPRTHDKSLCYIGGDTRIVAVDRKDKISISELNHRLSKTLNPQNQQFILKYQLPNEDLDSLISVSTDEDLENMVDEYDRLLSSKSSTGGKGRLRLFLFPKSAPNSIEGGFSESSLLGLDDDFVGQNSNNNNDNSGSSGGGVNQDVHSVPNSPMLNNTTSSFGSTSSPKVGIEEQFQHMGVSFPVARKPEEQGNRIFSDDERSDHGGYRLAQVQQIQPQVQIQYQQKQQTSAFDVPSPDSFSSDGSVTNPLSRQRQARYQESSYIQLQPKTMDQNTNNSMIQMQQQNQESEYVYDQNQPQFHQPQQFVHAGGQYIQSGAVPVQSYYHMYPQQQVIDQQYPLYYMPARQTQPYNMPSYTESTQNAPLSRPQMPPPASYNQSRTGPSTPASQQFVPIPLGQHQAQYVNYPQFQSMVPSSVGQMHYTQQPMQQPQLGSQFQTQLASTMVLPDASVENIKQQQQQQP